MRANSNIHRRFQCQNGLWVFPVSTVIVIVSLAIACICDAGQTFGRRHHTSSDASTRAPVPPLKRKMQSWFIRNGSQSRISAMMRQRTKHSTKKNDTGRTKQRGSFMTSQRPTKERLYHWFGVEGEDPNQFMRCMMLRNEFNHNLCGITNPFLRILTSSKPQQEQHARDADGSTYSELGDNDTRILRPLSQVVDDDCKGNTRLYEEKKLTARTNNLSDAITLGSSTNIENSWWPSLQITQSNDKEQGSSKISGNIWRIFQRKAINSNWSSAQNSSFKEQDWRILMYRERVGRGRDCYKKVRDAALDWEFQSADGCTGMMQVPDTSPSGDDFELETIPVASSNI